MTNIAMGPNQIINDLLFEKQANEQAVSSTPSAALRLIVEAMKSPDTDLSLKEIVLWLVANCMVESEEISLYMYNEAHLLQSIKLMITSCSQRDHRLTDQTENIILWNLDILIVKNYVRSEDLQEMSTLLDYLMNSNKLENKIEATRLLMNLIEKYNEEAHLKRILSHDTFSRMMRQLGEALNQPELQKLYLVTYKVIQDVLSVDSDEYHN